MFYCLIYPIVGVSHPFSVEKEPFTLCPTDERTFDLLEKLYAELLPNFPLEKGMNSIGVE